LPKSFLQTLARRAIQQYYEWQRAYLDLRKRIDRELNPTPPQGLSEELIHRPVGALPAKATDVVTNFRVGIRAEASHSDLRRILLVGRMDFFGFAVAQQLNNLGFGNILIADHLDGPRCDRLPLLEFDDVLALSELETTLERRPKSLGSFSQIFYFGPWGEGESPLTLPKALLQLAVENKGRLISFSSASSLGARPSREEITAGRILGLRPEGKAPVMAHLMDRLALRRSPANYLAIKHYRTFGPGESGDGCLYGVIRRAFEQIRSQGKVSLPVDLSPEKVEGRRKHDFLYIKDAAAMAVSLAAHEGASGICEIGSGEAHSITEVVRTVFQEMGREPAIEYTEDTPVCVSPEPEKADLSRLRKLGCSHTPKTLSDAVRDYLKEHLERGELSWRETLVEPEPADVDVAVEKSRVSPRPFLPKKRIAPVKSKL